MSISRRLSALAAVAALLFVAGCCCQPCCPYTCGPCVSGPCAYGPCAYGPCASSPCGGCCTPCTMGWAPAAPSTAAPATTRTVASQPGARAPGPQVDEPPAATPPKGSGFLSDYSGMVPGTRLKTAWVWMKPGMDLRGYDYLLIDDIAIKGAEEVKQEEMPEEACLTCGTTFRDVLVQTLDPFYTVKDAPGEHTLRVRLALTDILPAHGAEEGKPSLDTGGASIEVEILDSQTGESLLRGMDTRKGTTSGSGKWSGAEEAFHYWAKALLQFLDEHTKP